MKAYHVARRYYDIDQSFNEWDARYFFSRLDAEAYLAELEEKQPSGGMTMNVLLEITIESPSTDP